METFFYFSPRGGSPALPALLPSGRVYSCFPTTRIGFYDDIVREASLQSGKADIFYWDYAGFFPAPVPSPQGTSPGDNGDLVERICSRKEQGGQSMAWLMIGNMLFLLLGESLFSLDAHYYFITALIQIAHSRWSRPGSKSEATLIFIPYLVIAVYVKFSYFFLIDSPLSFILWALCTSLSRMASARVESPICWCQWSMGNWLVTSVDFKPWRSSSISSKSCRWSRQSCSRP